jgi:hypothetical protein
MGRRHDGLTEIMRFPNIRARRWAVRSSTAVSVLGARVAADAMLPVLRDGRGSLLFHLELHHQPATEWRPELMRY